MSTMWQGVLGFSLTDNCVTITFPSLETECMNLLSLAEENAWGWLPHKDVYLALG